MNRRAFFKLAGVGLVPLVVPKKTYFFLSGLFVPDNRVMSFAPQFEAISKRVPNVFEIYRARGTTMIDAIREAERTGDIANEW